MDSRLDHDDLQQQPYNEEHFEGIDDQGELMEDDVYLQKERELREATEQRIKGLEQFLQQKNDLIRQQADSLSQADHDIRHLKKLINERDQVLKEYDTRLGRAKTIIEQREMELTDCKIQFHDMYEKYSEEKELVERQASKISNLDRENKALDVKYRSEAENVIRGSQDDYDIQIKKLNHRIKELEKTLEVQRVTSNERMNMAIDAKENDIQKLKHEMHGLKVQH